MHDDARATRARRKRRGRYASAARAIAITAALGGVIGIAAAGPTGGSGTPGVIISDDGAGTFTIIAPDGSIIDWNTFSVANGELVQFMQGSPDARVLNRVNWPIASIINGTITADGHVYLVNPTGLIFGQGAIVNANSFYAVAGDLSNEDFLDGVDHFTNVRGDIVNEGEIEARDVTLVGEHVTNDGRITGTGGLITIVAGGEVLLQRVGDRIIVRVDGIDITNQDEPQPGSVPTDPTLTPGVTNTANGVIENDGGRIILGAGDFYGFAVHNLGAVQTPGGEIEIVAASGLIRNAGTLDASNPSGDAGSILMQGPDIQQAGRVAADAPNGAAGDLTFDAADDLRFLPFAETTANGAAGTGSITATANDSIRLRSDIETTGDIETESRNIVIFEDTTIASGGDQTHTGRLWLSADGRFEGENILFDGEIDGDPAGAGGLTVIGNATFTSAIGVFRPIVSLEVTGTTTLGASEVRTLEFQRYLDDVTLTIDTELESVNDALVRFGGAVDGPFGMVVDTAGLTRFDGPVGQRMALTRLVTNGGGSTRLADDIAADVVRFGDDVDLRGDARVTANTRATFGGTVAGNGNDLVITGPRVVFNGRVTDLDVLRVRGDGVTTIDTDRVSARVVRFEDAVRLASDLTLEGTDVVEIGGALDGAFALAVMTGGHADFGGDVGRRAQLASLRIDAGPPGVLDANLINFGGSLVSVAGDILLNPNGRSAPAEVATIAGTSTGSLLIESTSGRIVVGPNEKVTGLGDLTLRARAGSITVVDLNADGRLLVDAPLIELRRRLPGETRTASFGLVNDVGPELIATQSIVFTTVPRLIGGGADPIVASQNVSATLAALMQVDFRTPDVTFSLASLTLDLTPNVGITDGLAEALDETVRPLRRTALRLPFGERNLERLGIFVRSATFEERLAGTRGTSVFDDLPTAATALAANAPTSTTADRLWRDSVIGIGDSYTQIFDPNGTGAYDEAIAQQMRESLGRAWDSYVTAEPGEPSGMGWRAFLEEGQTHPDALVCLDSLQPLCRDLRAMGLSPRELARVWTRLDPIRPPAVDPAVLEEAAVGAPARVAMSGG